MPPPPQWKIPVGDKGRDQERPVSNFSLANISIAVKSNYANINSSGCLATNDAIEWMLQIILSYFVSRGMTFLFQYFYGYK